MHYCSTAQDSWNLGPSSEMIEPICGRDWKKNMSKAENNYSKCKPLRDLNQDVSDSSWYMLQYHIML